MKKHTCLRLLQPEEFRAALQAAPPHMLPALVLGGFCGLRPKEIENLDWSSINLEAKILEIDANNKSMLPRTIPLSEAAIAWFRPIAKKSGRVTDSHSHQEFCSDMQHSSEARGAEQISHILRHSNITYALALLNSEDTHEPMKKSAEKWFDIFPPPNPKLS